MTGLVYDIKRASTDDGPGIRTVIFLKGCSLKCVWCHSPESIRNSPELIFYKNRCILCGKCVTICPNGVHAVENSKRTIDIKKCRTTGLCAENCFADALEIKGRYYSVEEIFEIINKDKIFYRNSGGGVTVSGGEPTLQADFTLNVLKACKQSKIHTALDTCGHTKWHHLEPILQYTDLVLYDLKHMDMIQHHRLTGAYNDKILRNLEAIVKKGVEVRIRMPIIPGYNDNEENLKQTADYIKSLGIISMDILPFNELAGSKYEWLQQPYTLSHVKINSRNYMEKITDFFKKFGIDVRVQ